MKKLQKTVDKFSKSKEPAEVLIFGELGAVIGGQKRVAVPSRDGYVYVRVRSVDSEIIQAYNDKVSSTYGLPIMLKRSMGRYIVVGRDSTRYTDWNTTNNFVAPHGVRHGFDKDNGRVGNDLAWIYSYNIMPGQVTPFASNTQNVFIQPFPRETSDGNWNYAGGTGTVSLINYNPQASGSMLVVVSMDMNTGNPYLTVMSGTYVPITASGISQILPYLNPIPTNGLSPRAVVRLETGTSIVGWGNIYDIRQFVNSPSTVGQEKLKIVSSNYQMTAFDQNVYVTGSSCLIMLPSSPEYKDIVEVMSDVTATISGSNGNTILGNRGVTIYQNEAFRMQFTGNDWRLI